MAEFVVWRHVVKEFRSIVKADTIEKACDYISDFGDDLDWQFIQENDSIVALDGYDSSIIFGD